MDLGQTAYNAYGQNRGWKTYDEKPMPTWDELMPHIAAAWSEAAGAVAIEIRGIPHIELAPREIKEIEFAQHYVRDFAHGTSGHLSYMVISKLSNALSQVGMMVTVKE